jgi:hypothetical protein
MLQGGAFLLLTLSFMLLPLQWALHRSLAPARGAATATAYSEAPDFTRGQALGTKTAHYREKQWFIGGRPTPPTPWIGEDQNIR